MKYLAKIPATKYLKPLKEGKGLVTCKTKEELFIAMKCSEDMMIRTLSSVILRKNVHNKGWIKRLIEKDWCSDDGGHWVTIRGKHICMSSRVPWKGKRGIGWSETLHHGPGKSTKFRYTNDVSESKVEGVRTSIMQTPNEYVETLKKVEMSEQWVTMKEHYHGNVPTAYEAHADSYIGGYYHQVSKEIILHGGSTIGSFDHEFGHHIHSSMLDEDKNRWRYAWESERKVSRYAKVGPGEGFAEALKHYKRSGGRERMLKDHPKQTKFIDKILKRD